MAECTKAAPGFEPGNGGFADLCLTTWLCRRKRCANVGRVAPYQGFPKSWRKTGARHLYVKNLKAQYVTLERVTGLEPATPTLARLCSTN